MATGQERAARLWRWTWIGAAFGIAFGFYSARHPWQGEGVTGNIIYSFSSGLSTALIFRVIAWSLLRR